MKKCMMVVIGALTVLTGCGSQADKTAKVSTEPKWKGAPYHLAVDAQAPKPNPAGVTIPAIKYSANPDALEKRVILVVRFDASGASSNGPIANQMVMSPVDVSGAEGALPADYMDLADKELAKYLGAYCIKGKIKLTVALATSSLTNQAGQAELDAKRLSDWMPIEVAFKNPHPKC